MASELVDVELLYNGNNVASLSSRVDPDDPDDIQGLFEDMVHRDPSWRRREVSEYVIEVRRHRDRARLFIYGGRTR